MREELVALAQLVNDLDKTVAILNGFCDGCVMSHTCKRNCNRMTTLSNLVNDYIKLSKAYDVACSELTLGSQYFMNSTKAEVKEHFYNG